MWGFTIYGSVTGKQVVYKICHPTPLLNVGTVTGKLAGLAGGMQYCRASRKLLVESLWGNQGKFQTYSKSQKNDQDDTNRFS
jgi:hypothetical protein